MRIKQLALAIFTMVTTLNVSAQNAERWSIEKAKRWYSEHTWINRANFTISFGKMENPTYR